MSSSLRHKLHIMSPLLVYISEGEQGGSETSNVVRVGTVALTKREEAQMEVAELKVLRFSLRVTRMRVGQFAYLLAGEHPQTRGHACGCIAEIK